MSSKTILKFDPFCLSILLILIPFGIFGQSKDYHRDELPVISWNGVVLYDARSSAAAGISVFGSDTETAIANPALLVKADSILIGTSYALTGITAYQYQTMNTGVYYSPDRLYEFNNNFSALSATAYFGDINASAGFYKKELFDLPGFDAIGTGYSASAVFSGYENAYYLAASCDLSHLAFGAKITWVKGSRSASLNEIYDSAVVIGQNEVYNFDYFIISLGLAWKAAENINLSAVIDYPLTSTQDSEYSRTFDAYITGGAHIDETNTSQNDLYRPSKITAAALLTPFADSSGKDGSGMAIGLEITHTFWNSYRYFTFGDEFTRAFNDTTTLAAGLELPIKCRGFNLAIRGGYRFDPQPVPEPDTTLHWLTFGVGISIWNINLDVAGSYFFGSLPEWNPQNFTVIATLGFQF
jgi:hypothetical protein